MDARSFQVIVIGGGHAGTEAAWAAANLLGEPGSVALISIDASKTGVMSCNPAIGGLAKGQLVREIDAMGGLMGLATDATGIQFKVLNTSRGPAVHGPRAQCDKHAYAEAVQQLIASRREIVVVEGTVERIVVEGGRVRGVEVKGRADGGESAEFKSQSTHGGGAGRVPSASNLVLWGSSVVLTTGTFMRGLMHTGESKTAGGRYGEAAATGISAALRDLGFELGRLKTGTPPRLRKSTIDWNGLPPALGDKEPVPFSDLSAERCRDSEVPRCHADRGPAPSTPRHLDTSTPSLDRFPVLPQVECRETHTTAEVHELIRANLHRAPMYSGQIESVGPRYCPSIEDKVVRFAERESHTVFLEPESLRPGHDEWIYCNGISTSLPADVQHRIVRSMPGCEGAEILRHGYAVEYDMVRPHQIYATGMTKLVGGLFLAGQINGTSGYEEAAAQGLVAGINAARFACGQGEFVFGRDQAYIGVLMDDLITKTPVEPYRMFTSRAEHRLLLRPDNSGDRLTPIAAELGLLSSSDLDHGLGRRRREAFAARRREIAALNAAIDAIRVDGEPLSRVMRRPEFELADLERVLEENENPRLKSSERPALATVFADRKYAAYIERQHAEVRRRAELEHKRLPHHIDYGLFDSLRAEARQALSRFRPATFGQAGRLEGITPADLTLLAVLVKKSQRDEPPEAALAGAGRP